MTKKYLIFYFLILAALLLGAAPVGAAEEVQATLTAGQSEVDAALATAEPTQELEGRFLVG